MTGTLYIVGTPIGNLGDMTFRAVETLKTVELIAAEDTRRTGKLLQHFGITTPQISYHHHNRAQRTPELCDRLRQGITIALVSDAGMPGIADPGYELVCACVAAQIPVVPIPGVTAAITALAASGLSSDRFCFEGFLPAKSKPRLAQLQTLANQPQTLIFYEAPHRLLVMLQDLTTVLGGDRSVVITRELTKLHETFWRGTLTEAIAYYGEHSPKGEFTLLVAGASVEPVTISLEQLKTQLRDLLNQGMTRSQASRHLSIQTQLPRRQIYQLSLELTDQQP
ncbi:MAG: 16S rRNA (cytidine(1402)-2'-O)-methyltransferase [Spirulina sp. SIO3F2]|nr:16S rRNA (cytidine(1402)-2'-O)-methyltransferase [Spirulina sp. SIO3F2]